MCQKRNKILFYLRCHFSAASSTFPSSASALLAALFMSEMSLPAFLLGPQLGSGLGGKRSALFFAWPSLSYSAIRSHYESKHINPFGVLKSASMVDSRCKIARVDGGSGFLEVRSEG